MKRQLTLCGLLVASMLQAQTAAENVPTILSRLATQLDVVNTVSETDLLNYSVPAGILGTTKSLRVEIIGDLLENSGGTDTVTIRVKYGATTLFDDVTGNIPNSANRRPVFIRLTLANQNASNAQVLGGIIQVGDAGGATAGLGELGNDELHASTPVFGTAAEDSTAAKTLSVTVQWSSADTNHSFRRQYAKIILE